MRTNRLSTTSNSWKHSTNKRTRKRTTAITVLACSIAWKTSGISRSLVSYSLVTCARTHATLTRYRCWKYLEKPHFRAYATVFVGTLYTFFDWLLIQREGKEEENAGGLRSLVPLVRTGRFTGLVYERATGFKLDGRINRSMLKL